VRHVTDVEAEAALRQVAQEAGAAGRRYRFSSGREYGHSDAVEIARTCMRLDLPVTDIPDAFAWVGLMKRVLGLEERMERMARSEHVGTLL
jgi:hypothetical protein